jgi:hypothetical protein
MFSRAWSSACFLATLALTTVVHADSDDALRGNYVAIKVTLGIGGSSELDSDSVSVPALGASFDVRDASGWNDDLELSYGLAAQYMWDLHRYFALGGLFGVLSWRSEVDDGVDADRNIGFDLAIVPQGRLPLTDAIELYVSVPIGVTLDLFNQADRQALNGNFKLEGDSAIGFALSALLGARFAITRGFGLLAEFGYSYRTFGHEITVIAGGSTLAKINGDISLGQFALNVGAWF